MEEAGKVPGRGRGGRGDEGEETRERRRGRGGTGHGWLRRAQEVRGRHSGTCSADSNMRALAEFPVIVINEMVQNRVGIG